jgi:carbamoyl-phosphate synthase small subunit
LADNTPLLGRLVLADGTTLEGSGAGAAGVVTGELVFQTGMVGYQEVLTDPSYAGQILVFTYPLIGNYGAGPHACESTQIHARAVVIHQLHAPGGAGPEAAQLQTFLAAQGVPVLTGVDTRALVRHIRTQGVMSAALAVATPATGLPTAESLLAQAQATDYSATDHVAACTCRMPTWYAPDSPTAPTIALIDYGAKGSILAHLRARGAGVWVLPAHTPAAQIRAYQPEGVLLSNGPGNPGKLSYAVDTVRELLAPGDLPVMGICLGHQILAMALGGRTFKMAYGHRGLNQPVLEHASGRMLVTTQNHGYSVDPTSLPPGVVVTHTNLNDGTVEGLAHRTLPAWSVQWHPEAHPGPGDSAHLFDRFLAQMEVSCAA